MARPRKDGNEARPVNKRKLTQAFVDNEPAKDYLDCAWDTHSPVGLSIRPRPSSRRSYKVIYRLPGVGKQVTHRIGDARVISLDDARLEARRILTEVALGRDPAVAKKVGETFAIVAERYVEERAKLRNKSWQATRRLVVRYLLPRWGELPVSAITRSSARTMMAEMIKTPVLANQVLKSASAILTWAVTEEIVTTNPCRGVERYPTSSRERVLSDVELRKLYPDLDTLLLLVLFTGQRPGEVAGMRAGDVREGVWYMPGMRTGSWKGTKNSKNHRLPLSGPARALVPQQLAVKRSAEASVKASERLMQKLVAKHDLERATPHDLRRTCLTMITGLKFDRPAMSRIANHRIKGIADVYDHSPYYEANQEIMDAVAAEIMRIVRGPAAPSDSGDQ